MAYNQNAVDTVYNFVMEKIQSGEWPAGSRIMTELKLAELLGVSRVAVRDATQKLTGMSVLKKLQGSGTYVEKIDMGSLMSAIKPIVTINDQELLELMEFRRYFEPGNVRQFICNCAAEELEALEQNYAELKAVENDPFAFYEIDQAFHHMIATGTHNSFVTGLSDFYGDILKAQQCYISMRLGPEIALEDHFLIIKCIKEQDKELAALHMERHVQRAIVRMREYLAKTSRNQ
ncbi:MAG: FCD domain-containing protein [Candidatus Adiutrix sp.]|jgi:DNA-binding FadR family transcriptional regulator|nr:FCD domain-containing protein [Candidatus Adiutrix sp.]